MKQNNIKSLPVYQQPYERLELYGASALSNAELLAIIIKSGTKSLQAVDLASNIINFEKDGLLSLHYRTLDELKTIKGIGRVKAIQLKALAEISIRMSKSKKEPKVKVSSPRIIADLYMEEMRHLIQEQLKLVMLDTKNCIIKDQVLSMGTVNCSLIDPREILVTCLKNQCVHFIMVHNHPSGDPDPSQEDILITKRVHQASEIVGVHLLDHIIIGDKRFISLKEQGHMSY